MQFFHIQYIICIILNKIDFNQQWGYVTAGEGNKGYNGQKSLDSTALDHDNTILWFILVIIRRFYAV